MTFRSFLKSIIFMSQPSVAALNTIALNYPRDMMTTADHSLKGWAKMQHCFDFFFFFKVRTGFSSISTFLRPDVRNKKVF